MANGATEQIDVNVLRLFVCTRSATTSEERLYEGEDIENNNNITHEDKRSGLVQARTKFYNNLSN